MVLHKLRLYGKKRSDITEKWTKSKINNIEFSLLTLKIIFVLQKKKNNNKNNIRNYPLPFLFTALVVCCYCCYFLWKVSLFIETKPQFWYYASPQNLFAKAKPTSRRFTSCANLTWRKRDGKMGEGAYHSLSANKIDLSFDDVIVMSNLLKISIVKLWM